MKYPYEKLDIDFFITLEHSFGYIQIKSKDVTIINTVKSELGSNQLLFYLETGDNPNQHELNIVFKTLPKEVQMIDLFHEIHDMFPTNFEHDDIQRKLELEEVFNILNKYGLANSDNPLGSSLIENINNQLPLSNQLLKERNKYINKELDKFLHQFNYFVLRTIKHQIRNNPLEYVTNLCKTFNIKLEIDSNQINQNEIIDNKKGNDVLIDFLALSPYGKYIITYYLAETGKISEKTLVESLIELKEKYSESCFDGLDSIVVEDINMMIEGLDENCDKVSTKNIKNYCKRTNFSYQIVYNFLATHKTINYQYTLLFLALSCLGYKGKNLIKQLKPF